MPKQTPVATVIEGLSAPDTATTNLADAKVYQMDDRPGLFRRAKAHGTRTLTPSNAGATLAVVEREGKADQMVELVPFQRLYDLVGAEFPQKKVQPPAQGQASPKPELPTDCTPKPPEIPPTTPEDTVREESQGLPDDDEPQDNPFGNEQESAEAK